MTDRTGDTDDRIIDGGIRWSIAILLIILSVSYTVSRIGSSKSSAPIASARLPTYPPRTTFPPKPVVPQILLTDITQAAGIDFIHDRGARGEWRLPEAMGGGCVVFDYDLDGHQDILLIHANDQVPSSSIKLYRNDGTGSFSDVTVEAGLAASLVGMGGTAADFDNDGWPDILITSLGPNRLFHNRGGTFREVTDATGIAGDARVWSMGSCWVDYDRDGDLDLFIGNYLNWSAELDRGLNCCWDGATRSYCDPDLFAGVQPYFYENLGDGTFNDTTAAVGVVVKNRDTGQPVPKTLAVVACDLNDDGWTDLAVTGDAGQNLAYINTTQGGFQETSTELGMAYDRYGMATRSFGIDCAVLSDDQAIAIGMGRAGNLPDSLYVRSKEDKVFTDQSLPAGIATVSRPFLTFGICFVDMDLDGNLDVVLNNGQIQENFDTLQQSQSWRQTPLLFWQSRSDPPEFVPLTSADCGEEFCQPISGRGVAYADFDGDGDLDLLMTTVGGSPRLFRNDQQLKRNWIGLVLHARTANRDALETRLELKIGTRVLTRTIRPVGGYLSQHQTSLVVGLGEFKVADGLTIRWPDGSQEHLADVSANQEIHLVQKSPDGQPSLAEAIDDTRRTE
ncbi:CRTAC1 family protein [Schlesneria sp. DSM 10557]|uniref:CRTAC1 family protein n=1 Tax=Schlesneria sp. DSM 10557 TaxID=3044399 RepID=UPI0035A00BBC